MDQADIWDGLMGEAWVRNAELINAHGEAFGLAAMDRLGDVDGKRVLDVGCGTGATTRELYRRGAEVLGIDLSERMTAYARQQASGLSGIEHRVGTVEELPADEPFDALFSRFGVMFFADPVAAFRRLRSLTQPGGRIAYAAWNEVTENPWMSIPVLASLESLGVPELMAGPGEPGPFSLAPPARSVEVLQAADWEDIEVDVLTVDQQHPTGSLEEAATVFLEINPPLADGLRRQPDLRPEVHAAVVEALRSSVRDGHLVLQASALIVSATA